MKDSIPANNLLHRFEENDVARSLAISAPTLAASDAEAGSTEELDTVPYASYWDSSLSVTPLDPAADTDVAAASRDQQASNDHRKNTLRSWKKKILSMDEEQNGMDRVGNETPAQAVTPSPAKKLTLGDYISRRNRDSAITRSAEKMSGSTMPTTDTGSRKGSDGSMVQLSLGEEDGPRPKPAAGVDRVEISQAGRSVDSEYGADAPDRVYARHKTSLIAIELPAGSINEGKAFVGDLIEKVAATLQVDLRHVRLFYKGTELTLALLSLKEYYMKQNSEVVVLLTAPESGDDNYTNSDESDPSDQKRDTTIVRPESIDTSRQPYLVAADTIDPLVPRSVGIDVWSDEGYWQPESAVFSPGTETFHISGGLAHKLGVPDDGRIWLRWRFQGDSKSTRSDFKVLPGSRPSTVVLGQPALEKYQAKQKGAIPIGHPVRPSRDKVKAEDFVS